MAMTDIIIYIMDPSENIRGVGVRVGVGLRVGVGGCLGGGGGGGGGAIDKRRIPQLAGH